MKRVTILAKVILKAICGVVSAVGCLISLLGCALGFFVMCIAFPFLVFFVTSLDRVRGQEENTIAVILEGLGLTQEVLES